ncbi:MAG: hypothetical protein KAI45_10415, partial [Melioribacteraceae bacterium]|nr:hypothetical protein [Melioribacteraceae bacterium]
MKIFNPNENTKIDKLKKENEELRNTLHKVLTRQGDFEDLESKSESMKIRISDLAKEELRIEEYLKTTASEKAEKSKDIFEVNRQINELKKRKEDLESNNEVAGKKHQEQ